MAPKDLSCPCCGWNRPHRQNIISHEPGELVGIDLKKAKRNEWLENKEQVWREIVGYAKESKPADKAEKWALAQYRNLYDEWPRYAMRNITPEPPSYELHQKLRSMMIRYAKGMAKRKDGPEARA
jgi:hypothetical protein